MTRPFSVIWICSMSIPSGRESKEVASITTSFLAMKQVSRGFSWKRLYHYLSICLLTSEQHAPRVAMSHSVGRICIIIWALFVISPFSHIPLVALTEPRYALFSRKRRGHSHPHNYTDSAHGIFFFKQKTAYYMIW